MSNLSDPVKQFADSLTAADEVVRKEFGIPVEDFTLTLSLDVFATWKSGYRGTREEPAEPAHYEIEKVMCRGMDITNLLGQEDRERLELGLWE